MRAVLWNFWEDVSSSLWFVPAVLVFGAVILSYTLLWVDGALLPDLGGSIPGMFGGTPDGAREILSVIAGSLITVVAVAFSVTLVAIQQAASQYSPRLLRNFTSDRGNQVVLGTYIATFAYALLVMRQVRNETLTQEQFVPSLSLSVGIILALVSLALLIYFIHHTVQSLDVTHIVNSVRKEMESEMQGMFPSNLGQPVVDSPSFESLVEDLSYPDGTYESAIIAPREGYLRRLDEPGVVAAAQESVRLLMSSPRVGDYIPRETTIARVWSDLPLTQGRTRQLEHAFIISPSRTLNQDLLFGVKQIVDIALKALSPGVNDPTTAEQCMDQLGQIMGDLAQREFPSPLRKLEDNGRKVYLIFNRPSFGDFMEAGFGQIRRVSQGNVHVTLHLLQVMKKIAEKVSTPGRAGVITAQMMEVLAVLDSSDISDGDKLTIRRNAEAVLNLLGRQVTPAPLTC